MTDDYMYYDSREDHVYRGEQARRRIEPYIIPDSLLTFKPVLEGFEKVLGRKFICPDCAFFDSEIEYVKEFNGYGDCEFLGFTRMTDFPKWYCQFQLSDATKAEIKLCDKEIEDTKIDSHPRYPLGGKWGTFYELIL